jgi:hypothetical protein
VFLLSPSFHDKQDNNGDKNYFLNFQKFQVFLKSNFVFVIQADPESQSQSPVVHDDGVAYMFIQHNNVFLLTAARHNCNAASILLFLHQIVETIFFSKYNKRLKRN